RAIFKNLAFYLGALLSSPFDSILAHDLFGTTLPSQMRLDTSAALPIGAAVGIGVAAAALLWRRLHTGSSASLSWPVPLPWMEMLFLGAGIIALLLPFLLFNEHASETYLYLPVAFYCPLFAAVLHYSIRSS